MTAKNYHSFENSPNMPDFDSGALASQTAFAANETTEFQDAPMMSPQTNPQSPPKHEELSEIVRWKRELDEMREKKEQAEEITEMMTQDLCELQDEMAKKDVELKRNDEEITKLHQKIKQLTIQTDGEQPSSLQMNDDSVQTNKRLFEKLSFGAPEEMQLRFETLPKETEKTKEYMGTQLSQEQELRRIAEDKLRERGEELEIASIQVEELRQAEAIEFEAKLQKRASEAETLLLDRMETDENQEQLLQKISTLEQEVKDQRKQCDYFKKTSGRLSTRIKDREATLRAIAGGQPQQTKTVSDQKKGLCSEKAQSPARQKSITFSYSSLSGISSSVNQLDTGIVPGDFPGKSSSV